MEGETTKQRERIREILRSLGADDCGFASIDRFADAREGHRPTDLFSACRTVIVPLIQLPKGLMRAEERLIYSRFNALSTELLDQIDFHAAAAIEREFDCVAAPLPADGPYEDWDAERKTARGLLSLKHAAVAAGLGQMGKNTLFLHPRYGNLVAVGAILTDLALPSDPPAESICLPACRRCLDACPVHAIGEDGTVEQDLCRPHTYRTNRRGFPVTDCRACREVCPMAEGKKASK